MASLASVSAHTIRLWLKKHNIKWRTISESLLEQSDKVSARSKKVWSDPKKRARQSTTMIKVQSKRKEQLSKSAKKNWAANRDKIVSGIQRVANDPNRLQKCSEASKRAWNDPEYRRNITNIMHILWKDPEYRRLVRQRNKETVDSSAIKERWKNADFRAKMIAIFQKRANNNRKNCKIHNGKYIQECIDLHGDQFDYSTTNPVNWQTKIQVICNGCGNTLHKYPISHILHGHCEYCQSSSGERKIRSILDAHGHKYTVNDRSIISPLELDIYLQSKQLAIEYHGLYWHSYNQPETAKEKKKHQTKALACNQIKIRLLQFFEHELEQKPCLIESMILNTLGHSIATNARDLRVNYIENSDAQPFFAVNHLSGHRSAKVTLALTSENTIIMAMSFSKRYDGYEIIRMATKTGYRVRGGPSRLLTHFIRKYPSKAIYTFADLRYSNGGTYLALGFKLNHITSPGYFYCKRNQILSRQRCQKHKLPKLLSVFDPSLTESQNMFNNGYRRVWDAGHKHFIKRL